MPAPEMVERVLLPRSSRCRTTFTVRVTPASTLAVAVSRKKPGSDAVNLEPPGESPRALKIPCWCVRTVRVSPVGTLLTDTLTFGSGAPDAFATVPWIPPLLWAHPEIQASIQIRTRLVKNRQCSGRRVCAAPEILCLSASSIELDHGGTMKVG